ncbi:MAG: CorA family divalent cation transporter [Hyphomonadaceae bacterium]|nr:CorA family divalent cation transporter [Hyphomonadaceae bacterium]
MPSDLHAPEAPEVVWIDLEHPTDEEEACVETALGVDVPTHDERAAFEDSARFYEDDGALVMTVTLLGRREDGPFKADAVTFILVRDKLVTVRRIRPRAFEIGQGRASARVAGAQTGAAVFLALATGSVERLADLLAEVRGGALTVSRATFDDDNGTLNLSATLRTLGRLGTQATMTHESLSSLQRMLAFVSIVCDRHGLDAEAVRALARDVEELERDGEALSQHLAFLQNAAVGLVSSAQNNALRGLALATIAFAPPTLVASIFGMNFEAMDWFKTGWGPWAGFALMLAAPLALFALARWRKWF